MADTKAPPAEETVDTAIPKSTDTEVADNETLEGTSPDESTTTTEETSTPPADEKAADEKIDDETDDTETDELDSFLNEPKAEEKDGVQKRIDKLTAEKYQLKAELDEYKSKDRSNKPPEERVYTEVELDSAERKAFVDNDYDLMLTVRKEREKNLKSSLRKEYLDEQRKQQESYARTQSEWAEVKDSYQYLSAPMKPEIYTGSREELNIGNPTSNLVRLARALYSMDRNKVAELLGYSRDYSSQGGQERAVADALRLILDKRRTQKSDSPKTRMLQKQLTREKRKSSLGSPGGQKAEDTTPKKPQSPDEILKEYVDERNAWKTEKVSLKD